jgi:CBS domain containing-hemolysin-like protein
MEKIIISIALVASISALCSLIEATLYSVPMRFVEAKVEVGAIAWQLFKKLRKDIDKSIAAIVSLNTIVNTLGATIVGSLAVGYLGESYVGLLGIIFTSLILLFGEIVPKTMGVVFGRFVGPYVSYVLLIITYLMAPVVWVASWITRVFTSKAPSETVSPEEIRVLARLGLISGGLGAFESRVIEGILSLRGKRVKEVMTPRTVVFSLPVDLSLDQIKDMDIHWEHSRVPVYKGSKEEVVGIVLTKELFLALSKGRHGATLQEFTRPVSFISEMTRLDIALMEFLKTRQHLFVVLDEFGGVSGVITLEDVVEEILGQEIVDESDLVDDKQKLAKLGAQKRKVRS